MSDTEKGILFKLTISTIDLIGSGAKYATVAEMKKRLDELEDEDV